MTFTIKFIKNCDFVATRHFTGTLEEAGSFAIHAMKENHADMAAVMDPADPDGAPKALIEAAAEMRA